MDWLSGIPIQSSDEENADEDYWSQDDSDEEEKAAESSWILSEVREHPRLQRLSDYSGDSEVEISDHGRISFEPPPSPPDSSDLRDEGSDSDRGQETILNHSQRYHTILEYGKGLARICASNKVIFPLIAEKMDR
jgi:hypothetical protein